MQPAAQPIKPLFKHVTIIGVGLLGGSLAMALREKGLAQRVTGVGRPGSASLDVAMQRGAVDDVTSDMRAGVRDADLVVLATNISSFASAMDVLAEASRPDCLVTDVGSTKDNVMQMARERMPNRCFVGSHPMAGSEKSGPEFARADLYHGALCLVVPPERIASTMTVQSDAATKTITDLWHAVGMRTYVLDAHMHDEWVAIISHVPHLLAALMVNLTADIPQARMAAAGGFFDTTRVASGNVDMWTDILISNHQIVKSQLLKAVDQLDELHLAISSQDREAIRRWLSTAKTIRDQMLAECGKR